MPRKVAKRLVQFGVDQLSSGMVHTTSAKDAVISATEP